MNASERPVSSGFGASAAAARRGGRAVKLLTFAVKPLTLGIPISSVCRVLLEAPVFGSGRTGVGIAHYDDRKITAFDLSHQVYDRSDLLAADVTEEVTVEGSCVVVLESSTGERFGIFTAAAPALLDVPADRIRLLPPSYRSLDALGICSRVAMLPQQHQPLFIIDADYLAERAATV